MSGVRVRDSGDCVKRSIALLLLACGLASAVPVSQAASAAAHPEGPGWTLAQSSPAELMRQATNNELTQALAQRPSLRYRLRKVTPKSDTTKEIVETRSGAVARLIAVGGRPLSAAQRSQEIDRLHALAIDPAVEVHRRRSEARDSARVEKFLRLLPDAFLYRSAGAVETPQGTMVRLAFTPNPKFSPPDFESRILTGIRGEVWIDPAQIRIAKIQGRIFTSVDFGWGILGSLSPGGTMLLEQSKTPECGWQMTHLELHLDGKALLFKRVHIAMNETAADYRPIPREWTYKDAVAWLVKKFEPAAETNS